jgi:hypothetical protein
LSGDWDDKPLKHDFFEGSKAYKDQDIIPQVQFVLGSKYYFVKHNKIMEISFMDIDDTTQHQNDEEDEKNELTMKSSRDHPVIILSSS